MKEKYKDRILIDMGEFQSKILEHVCSEEFNKQFGSTQFSTYEDAKGYRQAMMHGMVMASLMTAQCGYLCVKEKLEKEEQGYVNVHQGYEDEYYEECSICHSKEVSVDDNFCSNCGVKFFGIKKQEHEPIENKLADMYGVDTIEFEDPEEFIQHYCHNCGSQRCEGVGTEWFEGCQHKEHLKDYEKFYGDD